MPAQQVSTVRRRPPDQRPTPPIEEITAIDARCRTDYLAFLAAARAELAREDPVIGRCIRERRARTWADSAATEVVEQSTLDAGAQQDPPARARAHGCCMAKARARYEARAQRTIGPPRSSWVALPAPGHPEPGWAMQVSLRVEPTYLPEGPPVPIDDDAALRRVLELAHLSHRVVAASSSTTLALRSGAGTSSCARQSRYAPPLVTDESVRDRFVQLGTPT